MIERDCEKKQQKKAHMKSAYTRMKENKDAWWFVKNNNESILSVYFSFMYVFKKAPQQWNSERLAEKMENKILGWVNR